MNVLLDATGSISICRLREARVTGVTCASSTLPILTHPPSRTSGGVGAGGGSRTGIQGSVVGLVRRGRLMAAENSARNGVRRRKINRGYDIVLLDECSQILEPISLLPQTVAQFSRLVLVGDPLQLPPALAHARVRTTAQETKSNTQKTKKHLILEALVSFSFPP